MNKAADNTEKASRRVFAIGDIHGCHVALEMILAQIRLKPEDTLVVLGDIVDRGPGTRQVIEQLLELATRCELIFVRGNHEEMMLQGIDNGPLRQAWLRYGGQDVIHSYSGDEKLIPKQHVAFIESSIDYWQTDSDIFIHANLAPDVQLDEQNSEWLRWIRITGSEPPHPSGKRVICGHSAQQTGHPFVWNGWVCLDTWVYGDGWLTCLNVDTNEVLQARQDGTRRDGRLDDV